MTLVADRNKLAAKYILGLFLGVSPKDIEPTGQGYQHQIIWRIKGGFYSVPLKDHSPPDFRKRWERIGRMYQREIYRAV